MMKTNKPRKCGDQTLVTRSVFRKGVLFRVQPAFRPY
jgi:hypothetical protein